MQPPVSSSLGTDAGVVVRHRVCGFSDRWVIPEVPVPESAVHDRSLQLLMALLDHWLARTGRDAAVFRNIAVRVREDRPSVGFDPDISLVEPAPPGAEDLTSLRLWEAGHTPPALAIEVVSANHPYKDYTETPDQCAAAGVRELVVFDPLGVGPKAHGGPAPLSLWRRAGDGGFERVYSGSGPAFSEVLDAHFFVAHGEKRLRLANDAALAHRWLTAEEAARERIAELEARLGQGER